MRKTRTCGIHIDGELPCLRCLEAAAAIDTMLADFVPTRGERRRTNERSSDEIERRVHELRGEGLSFKRIAKVVGTSSTKAAAIVSGGRYGQGARKPRGPVTAKQRAAKAFTAPVRGEREHFKTMPAPRRASVA